MTDPIDDLRAAVAAWAKRGPGSHGHVTNGLPRNGEPRYTVTLMDGDCLTTRCGLTRETVQKETPVAIVERLASGLMVIVG